MKISIYTIWVLYKGEQEFNCADAWDEGVYHDNMSGFNDKVNEFKSTTGVEDVRVVILNVDEKALSEALSPPQIDATVEN